jgi:hypothetical protein
MIAGSLVLLWLPLEAPGNAVSIARALSKQLLMLLLMLPLPAETVLRSTQALHRFRFSVLAGRREPAPNSSHAHHMQCGEAEHIALATAIPHKGTYCHCHG